MSRILQYPELEGTLKDHGIPTPGPAQSITPRIPPTISSNNSN